MISTLRFKVSFEWNVP